MAFATSQESTSAIRPVDPTAMLTPEQIRRVQGLDNNALIIRLHFTINNLSRWLSPVHDRTRLERAPYFGEPSVKDLLIAMRDEERRVYPRMFAIVSQNDPDLDALPPVRENAAQRDLDAARAPIELLAQFRRLRQSTCSLLRSTPDNAWGRDGTSRRGFDVTIRELAEHLAEHDEQYLRAMDAALDRSGARNGLAAVQKASYDELLALVPDRLEI
ncbi:MAG: DinB family protein [Thermomicrobiales bacterium]